MVVREATVADIDAMMHIYAHAREYMRASGNPTQWGSLYPQRELVEADVAAGRAFVATDEEGHVHGAFSLVMGEEPMYRTIDGGAWLDDEPYGTLHRVASDGTARGLFASALAFARTRTDHIRADTHANNLTMQHVLEKNGFVRCGVVRDAAAGATRIAYQLPAPTS